MKVKYIALDVANTLLHKPDVYKAMHQVLAKHRYDISLNVLKKHHKLVSELIQFPDVTNKTFYHYFNAEFLLSLGVFPSEEILEEVFTACTYKDWKPFNDTAILDSLEVPLGIFSNFNKTLPEVVKSFFDISFEHIIASESLGVAKPTLAFYERAIAKVGIPAENILYIGDSLKLDILPAKQLGMQTLLVDRDNFYLAYPKRIVTLNAIKNYL